MMFITNKVTKLMASMLTMLLAFPSVSFGQQKLAKLQMPTFQQQKLTMLQMPTGCKMPCREAMKAALHKDTRGRSARSAAELLKSATGTTLWGEVILDSTWDEDPEEYPFVAYDPMRPGNQTQLFEYDIVANGGSALKNGIFYFVGYTIFSNNDGSFFRVYPYLYKFDTSNWHSLFSDYEEAELPVELTAYETAQHHRSGTVYGQFFNADANDIEWGVVDYDKATRTTIGVASHMSVALGVTSDGRLYSVASDGNLYQVNTTTGAETLVGPTGLQVRQADGNIVYQSGEIDQADDTFYWTLTDNEGHGAIYTVDLQTGAASKLSDLGVMLLSMVAPPAPASTDAPAAIADLTLDLREGAFSGNITFTAPTTTLGGQPLSGQLTYTIFEGANVLTTGQTTAGQTVSYAYTQSEGYRQVAAIVTNSAGDSPAATVQQWVGTDTPNEVADLNLVLDNTGKAMLTWTAPKTAVHNGYMGQVMYDVYRVAGGDTLLVGEGLAATAFTEVLEKTAMQSYKYKVVAKNNAKASTGVFSNAATFGEALDLPYFTSFDTEEDFSLYTVINANNDICMYGVPTWRYDANRQYAIYLYGNVEEETGADDWLITPALKLQKGRTYKLEFRAMTYNYDETFEVLLGQGTTVDAMTETLIAPTTFRTGDEVFAPFVVKSFSVPEDGEYNIGFHDISQGDFFEIAIDSISVDVNPLDAAPAAVQQLSLNAGPRGALSATLTFTSPSQTFGGDELTELSRIDVVSGGKVVGSIDSPVPGEPQEFEIDVVADGRYTFELWPYNNVGLGEKAAASAFIGKDLPRAIQNGYAVTSEKNISLHWQMTDVGVNGGYVDVDQVKYEIYSVIVGADGSARTGTFYGSQRGGNSFVVNANGEQGEQDFQYYVVFADMDYGEGNYGFITAIKGKTYGLPLVENFSDTWGNYFWYIENSGNGPTIGLSDTASDGDGTGVMCRSRGTADNYWMNFVSGKVNVAGAENPTLVFSHAANGKRNMDLAVGVELPNGQVDTLRVINYRELSDYDWQTAAVSLAAYQDQPYVQLHFDFFNKQSGTGQIYVDDVRVGTPVDKDLSISVSAPDNLTKGQDGQAVVTIRSLGTATAAGYRVRLYADGELVDEKVADEPLEPYGKTQVRFNVHSTTLMEGDELALKAEVVFDGDANEANNVAETTIDLETLDKIPAENLKAVLVSASEVNLTWNGPDTTPVDVVEDFEDDDYEAFDVGGVEEDEQEGRLGQWRLYDEDNLETVTWDDAEFDYAGEWMAWQVFRPADAESIDEEILDGLAAHSGSQYLISMAPIDEERAMDWLISPELPGTEQTVTFWARCAQAGHPERFQLYYSTGGYDIDEDFEEIEDFEDGELSTEEWTRIEFVVPEGTKFFAIRKISTEGFGLMVDDFSFQQGPEAPVAYNVYRDKKLIGSIDAQAEAAFTDVAELEPDRTYHYAVTAVYSDGAESVPVYASVDTGILGIAEMDLDHAPAEVYTLQGVRLDGRAKPRKGVYIVNGRKVVLR